EGIGKALVRACVRFARRAGYTKVVLGTDDVAVSARSIYSANGFRRVEGKPHRAFGLDLVGETWELAL
ncbi:MAG TPA: GNAT family N-acetyltransferase, partial [Candidatus Dormibacteraeota bacterium]|nr:GNAT family N-acetyltransferase [Candidatus Dormibacteraeota bacterium]